MRYLLLCLGVFIISAVTVIMGQVLKPWLKNLDRLSPAGTIMAPAEDRPAQPEPSEPIRFRVKHLQFDVPPARDELTELSNRLKVSQIYWAVGEVSDRPMDRNTAVGVLDSSIPMPGLPEPPKRQHNHYSEYGSLRELLRRLELSRYFTNAHGEQILTEHEQLDLWFLSRRNSPPYLLLSSDQYRQLVSLLDKLVKSYEADAQAPPEAPDELGETVPEVTPLPAKE